MAKGKLRHIAMSVKDPQKSAEFYKEAFGMEQIATSDSDIAKGVFLSDGVINLALLAFKSDEMAQGTGKDYVGLHHIGFWVDDPQESVAAVEKAGASYIMGEVANMDGGFYEIKYTDPNGVIFDISHHGWGGAQKNPGEADNEVGPERKTVEARRQAARAAKQLEPAGD
jgi:catechol 2,3-dioxygenase-like lactoylglutathione lyase family enzyme